MSDFLIADHGSIFVLNCCTPAAEEWVTDNVSDDAITWGFGIVIEPRYVNDILDGILADGLSVEADRK